MEEIYSRNVIKNLEGYERSVWGYNFRAGDEKEKESKSYQKEKNGEEMKGTERKGRR